MPEATTDFKTTIFIKLTGSRDKQLITEQFGADYNFTSDTDELFTREIDLIICDFASFAQLSDQLVSAKNSAGVLFLPLLIMVKEHPNTFSGAIWDHADDVVQIPVSKQILKSRVALLLKTRTYSRQLNARQQKLKEKNDRLKIFFNAIQATSSGIVISDEQQDDRPIIFCNNAFLDLTGYEQNEVIGKNCRFLQKDDRDQDELDDLKRALAHGEPGTFLLRNYRKDGLLFWNELKIAPIKDSDGNVDFFVGIQNDVTEQIKTLESLESAREKWESLVSQSPDLIQVCVDGVIRFINTAGAEMYGMHNPEELIGEEGFIHYSTIYNFESQSEADRSSDKPKIYTFTAADGQNRYLKAHSIDVVFRGEKATQTVAQDVTEIIEAEKQIYTSLKEKEALLTEVHHRVKNNLAVVSSMMYMQAFSEDDDHIKNRLMESVGRIKAMANIHEQLYQSTNFSELNFAESVKRLVEGVINAISSQDDIDVTYECDDVSLSVMQAVPCSLIVNEVITNVVKHAFKEETEKQIAISLIENQNLVTLEIRDNGVGLPENFNSLKNQSLGLRIIDVLSNQINATHSYSDLHSGTSFTLEFTRKTEHTSYLS